MSTTPNARIVLDSLNTANGRRATAFIIVMNRFVLAEMNTHRALSKNTASSRAIPVMKGVERVRTDTAMPMEWGSKKSGMQAGDPLDIMAAAQAEAMWRRLARICARGAERMDGLRVHKQLANRVMEPFAWTTTMISGTDWENFFALRCHEDAQPEIAAVADEMLFAYVASKPADIDPGQWHIPFGDRMPKRTNLATRLKIATARAARTSHVAFDGEFTVEKDVQLHDDLAAAGHWSPFEHSAKAMRAATYSGNFCGFKQYRKTFPFENRRVDLVALAATRLALKEQKAADAAARLAAARLAAA